MRRAVTIGVSLLLAAVAFAITTFAIALTSPGQPASSTGLPILSPQQRAQVSSLATRDSSVVKLTKGHSYRLTRIVVWTTFKGRLLGGVATLTFVPRAQRILGTWVALDYDCSETSSRLEGRVPYYAERVNVSSLTVFVDLGRKQVVGIDPNTGAGFLKKSPYRGVLPVRAPPRGFKDFTCTEG